MEYDLSVSGIDTESPNRDRRHRPGRAGLAERSSDPLACWVSVSSRAHKMEADGDVAAIKEA